MLSIVMDNPSDETGFGNQRKKEIENVQVKNNKSNIKFKIL